MGRARAARADLVYRTAVWGVIGRNHRRADLPRSDELERGAFAEMAGRLSRCGRAGSASGAGSLRASSSARGSCTARGNSVRLMMDAVAPGLLLAQGIGRWGNYWNQGLYGKATDLPWALEINTNGITTLHHPTFLYEFIWDLLGVGALPLDRSPLSPSAACALCALRDDLHRVSHVRGDAARRPVTPSLGHASELLRVAGLLHRLDCVLHLVAVPSEARRAGTRAAEAAPAPRYTYGAGDEQSEGPRAALAR